MMHVPYNNEPPSTIVVHSRYAKGVGMAHKIKPPENQPRISQMTMWQYKLSFQIDAKFFQKIAMD